MIVGARGLRDADWIPGTGASDCFCKVKVADDPESLLHETATINNTLCPVWEEEVQIAEFQDGKDLEFSVWDADTGTGNESLGNVVLKNEDFKDGFNKTVKLLNAGEKQKDACLRIKVKTENMNDYPEDPPHELIMEFEEDPKAKQHGLDLDEMDGKYLFVMDVKTGAFKKYNEKQENLDARLAPRDFIMKVNEKEGNVKEMLKELQTAKNLKVVVRRPQEIIVAIDKKEAKAPLGLEFAKKSKGNALLINKVLDGPIKDWNDQNEKHKVCDLDRIVDVAYSQGKASALQAKMTKATKFHAIVVRPAEAGTHWGFW
jgi:hypothetical protein